MNEISPILNILNDHLNKNKIPLIITQQYDKDYYNFFNNQKLCSKEAVSESDENTYNLKFINIINNDVVSQMILERTSNICLYINLRCTNENYTGVSLGIFMGFCAVYIAERLKLQYVTSQGMLLTSYNKKLNSKNLFDKDYKRNGNDEIVLSQFILIKKLGFKNNYKLNKNGKVNINKQMNLGKKCQVSAETYLNLHNKNSLTIYEDYKQNFIFNPRNTMIKYLNKIKNINKYNNSMSGQVSSIKKQNLDNKKNNSPNNKIENSINNKPPAAGYNHPAQIWNSSYEQFLGGIKVLKKNKKIRKHQGIYQIGPKAGKLKPGYKYSGEKTKTGLKIIIKI